MRVAQGGTQKWCPTCQVTTVCAAVSPTQLGAQSGQRWQSQAHEDIQWFRRGLICQTCESTWFSAEVPEAFIDELIELRDALREIKAHAEDYVKESSRASKSLKRLSESLQLLRALKIYREQE